VRARPPAVRRRANASAAPKPPPPRPSRPSTDAPLTPPPPLERRHLLRYLEWARAVPEARLEVVLSSLQGSLVERARNGAGATAAPLFPAAPARWAPAMPEPPARRGSNNGGGAAAAALSALALGDRGARALSGPASAPLPAPPALAAGAAAPSLATSSPALSLLATWSGASSAAAAASPRDALAGAVTLAQEQMEGVRRLRRLKSRLHVSADGGAGGLGSPVYPHSLAKAMSVESEAAAAAAAGAPPARR
jgi:hypothetical protein